MYPRSSDDGVALELKNLCVGYGTEAILSDLNLTVRNGSIVALMGPNGTGKTTLLLTIAGMIPPLSGSFRVKDTENLGFVLQDPQNQVVGNTVEEDIAFGIENRSFSGNTINRIIDENLERFSMSHLRKSDPSTLSAGQLQLLALASACAMSPKLYLLDEPFSMIGRDYESRIIESVKAIRRDGATVIVTASRAFDVMWTDRVIGLKGGSMIFDGDPDEVATHYEKLFGELCFSPEFFRLLRKC